MRLLLDTHVLLWALKTPTRLDRHLAGIIEDPANEVLFSALSIWEVGIKSRLGRADFTHGADETLRFAKEAGFAELTVTSAAGVIVGALPLHHRDPFDRLLVAQAIDGAIPLFTADGQLARYTPLVRLIG